MTTHRRPSPLLRRRLPAGMAMMAAMFAMPLAACAPTLSFFSGERRTAIETGDTTELPAYWQGRQGLAAGLRFETARDEKAWEEIWQLTGVPAPVPLPQGKMAVAVFLGPRPTEGYNVDIPKIENQIKLGQTDQLKIHWRELRPATASDASSSENGGNAPAAWPKGTTTNPWIIELTEDNPALPDFTEESSDSIFNPNNTGHALSTY